MTMSLHSRTHRFRQRIRQWIAVPATALAIAGGVAATGFSRPAKADEVVAPRASTASVGPGGTGANQRSVQRQNNPYETMPTRRYRRGYGGGGGGGGRYYSSRPYSSYYRTPGYGGYYGGGGYYRPRSYGYGGFGGYGGYGYGYPGFYGQGSGYYGGRGAIGVGPLTFWW